MAEMAAPLMVEAVIVVRDEEKERQDADRVWVRDVIRMAAGMDVGVTWIVVRMAVAVARGAAPKRTINSAI